MFNFFIFYVFIFDKFMFEEKKVPTVSICFAWSLPVLFFPINLFLRQKISDTSALTMGEGR